MKIHDVIQGTSEWLAIRAGIPTASNFARIITPKTGKPSGQAEDYMFQLIAERLMGRPVIEHVSFWMNRVLEMEAEAVSFYELQRDAETKPVGFVTNDEETVGASPDRTVDEDGLLEIKVPKESTHVGYLLKHAVDTDYFPQIMGQMWVAERKWVDLLSYHPEMPPALIRVERDEAYIRMLAAAVNTFSEVLESQYRYLIDQGIPGKKTVFPPPSLAELLKESLIEVNRK